MPQDPPARQLLHTREVIYRVYSRDDELWDVEASLLDTKAIPLKFPDGRSLQPGDAVHHMTVTATLDDDLRVVSIAPSMRAAPFNECQQAQAPLQALIGSTMGPGWRRAIESAMGGVAGCTHLRELLSNMATAAIQAVPLAAEQRRRDAGLPVPGAGHRPHYVGGCMSWRLDGPVVARLFPQHALPPPPKEAK